MRKIFTLFFLVLVTLGFMIQEVDAKRFGSGRSFGMQRSSSTFSRAQPTSAPFQQNASQRNKWLGPLAGFAAGGLLASLFMGHGGMGGSILSWLAIAAVILFLWSFIRNRLQTSPPQYQRYAENVTQQSYAQPVSIDQASSSNPSYPKDFDSGNFLREAKVKFIRLQAAFDSKNLNDLREFTTPEVFGEIQLQLQERGNETNYTEVVTLNAELLDVATESQNTVASVRFSGMIKEEVNAPATALNEVWHFRKEFNNGTWTVAGVEQ